MSKKKDDVETLENQDSTNEKEEKITPKTVTLVSGAEYWDFNENPKFLGHYDSPVKRERDEVNGEGKTGDLIGFNFADTDGDLHIISNSYAIEKALQMDYQGTKVLDSGNLIEIIFLGKGENSKGQPFNRFKVGMIIE